MKMTTDFALLIRDFMTRYLVAARNVSQNTVFSYRDSYVLLLLYLNECCGLKPENLKVQNVSPDRVEAFLKWIEETRGCSIKTRNLRLVAIHSLFRYIAVQQPEFLFQAQQILAIPKKKTVQALVSYLPATDIEALLAAPDPSTSRGLRDQAMLCLLYDSGCRVQELADLKVHDLRLSSPEQVTLTGKGRKTRVVPILKKTSAILCRYIETYGLDCSSKRGGPLFFNVRGEPLTRQGISYVLKKYADTVKLEHVTPHVIRHSKAMHLTDADINPVYIRDFLGHADLKTTQVYSKTSIAMKKKAIESLEKTDTAIPETGFSLTGSDWCSDKDLMEWLKSL